MLRVGLLRMEELPDATVNSVGTIRSTFERFVGVEDAVAVELIDIPVFQGALPSSLDDADAWIISGSPASVFDPLPWIADAEQLVRDLVAADRPVLGVCFGHQLMAQVLGGTVIRWPDGYRAGRFEYRTVGDRAPAIGASTLGLMTMHQDQVVEVPPGAEVWLESDGCAVAGLRYSSTAWSIQPHPEFDDAVVRALCADPDVHLGDGVADSAVATLTGRSDGAAVAGAFLEMSLMVVDG